MEQQLLGYTGSTETLNDLITTRSMSDLVDAEQQTYQFAMVLEHWLLQYGELESRLRPREGTHRRPGKAPRW